MEATAHSRYTYAKSNIGQQRWQHEGVHFRSVGANEVDTQDVLVIYVSRNSAQNILHAGARHIGKPFQGSRRSKTP